MKNAARRDCVAPMRLGLISSWKIGLMGLVAIGASAGLTRADFGVQHGVFSAPSPFLNDPAAVAQYKSQADLIAAGNYSSKTEFLPLEIIVLGSNTNLYASSYYLSVFDGLQSGDIVLTSEKWEERSDSSLPWRQFNSQVQYALVESYQHTNTETIVNWRDFAVQRPDGTFRFAKGTGLFWRLQPDEKPDDIIDLQHRVTRDWQIIRGGTLINPIQTSRGYRISTTGVTGGTILDSGRWVQSITVVPEPSALALFGSGVVGLGLVLRAGPRSRRVPQDR